MILLELKCYIKNHKQVTFMDIKNHFNLSDDSATGLVAPLLQQGYVQVLDMNSCATGSCATSSNCAFNSNGASYLWIDKPLKPLAIPIQIMQH